MIGKALAWISGARTWLTLLVVAAAAAWLYAQFHQVRSDRDALRHWADVTCAATGYGFAASTIELVDADGNSRPTSFARGQRCALEVGTLAAFRADTHRESAQLLADTARTREEKARIDALIARDTARATAEAARLMAKADAQIEPDNRVDRGWFAALNDVAGLRADD